VRFFLVHNPGQIPKNWNGWAICGHCHNKYPEELPFINQKRRIINVSVEMTGYKPVEISKIISEIKKLR